MNNYRKELGFSRQRRGRPERIGIFAAAANVGAAAG